MIAEAEHASAAVDVVVVSCNSGALLEDCIARVLMAEDCASLRLYDNASTDGWPQRVRNRFSSDARFALMEGERNIGFGRACNRAAADGKARWVLYLNPDCLIESTTLRSLRALLITHPGVGLLGADVRNALGREEPAARRRDPTPQRLLHDHGVPLTGSGGGVHLARNADELQIVDACSGALMLLPRHVVQQLQGFDEAYFLHGEDLDLCARVRALGLSVAVANEVRVVHRQGSSSHARPVFVAWHKHIGLCRFLLRHQVRGLWSRAAVVLGIGAVFLVRGLPKAIWTKPA